jgi:hypothetical protein
VFTAEVQTDQSVVSSDCIKCGDLLETKMSNSKVYDKENLLELAEQISDRHRAPCLNMMMNIMDHEAYNNPRQAKLKSQNVSSDFHFLTFDF